MTGVCIAYFIASAVPSLEAATVLVPVYVATCMFFGGLFIVYDKILKGWEWYAYTTFLRYGWTALMVNQFKGIAPESAGLIPANGFAILKFYGISDENEWVNLGWLSLICFVFALLGALGVQFIDYSKR
jgi:ABC-type multidrug transport system permease subunit